MTVSLPSGQRDDKSRINYEHAKDGRDRSRLRRHSPIDRVDTSSRCPSCCATTRLFHFSAESRPRSPGDLTRLRLDMGNDAITRLKTFEIVNSIWTAV